MREIAGYRVPDRVFNHMQAAGRQLGTVRIEKYRERMEYEFASIRSWIPNDCHVVLDIGCGIGGIDIEIANRLGTGITHLLDGDGTGERKNGLKEADKPWGDVTIAYEFVLANVPRSHVVKAHYPWKPFVEAVDLVVSIRSWGHHYPIDTYMDLCKRALSIGGRVIVDLRFPRHDGDRDASDVFEENGFELLSICATGAKCSRHVFEKVTS